MKERLLASASAVVFILAPGVALAQDNVSASEQQDAQLGDDGDQQDRRTNGNEIVVTATRRAESLQDVPLSITAFQQEELTEKGIVGYEGLARETPGVVVNKPTANFNNFTARGIATNGYGANLQGTVAIYIDELPISANGNSTILDPTLFDVERVEFLRGPQGTLFGSNSLAGAVRILTKSPDVDKFDAAALVDVGLTDGDALRQRYNGMVNIPLVDEHLALRVVGFYRHEDGWVDNLGTGVKGANVLEDYGGRAMLQWEPNDRFKVKAMVLHENSKPEDSALTNPDRGTFVRYSDRPDLFQAKLTSYNLSLDWDLGFANFVSSTTYSTFDQAFVVDLAGTFAQAFPFALDAYAYDDIYVQEMRLASSTGGPFEWVLGGFYYDKERQVDYGYRSSREYLAARGFTGLSDEYYQRFTGVGTQSELAGFGQLTYRFSDAFWLTGGARYTSTEVWSYTKAGGYNSNYLAAALTPGYTGPLTVTPIAAATGRRLTDDRVSYKVSASFKPTRSITTYATVSTGFRSPVANARAGLASVVDPSDIVIPEGAASDTLTNYEVGVKGSFLDGALTANLAAYYIDWQNIQVQANRLSDQVQFATNIGAAVSKGIEFEIGVRPVTGLSIALNGSVNDAEVTELTDQEAAMSGAENGIQLASPHFQGSATVRYDFALGGDADAFVSANAAHVGKFPGLFPNVPGHPDQVNPTYDYTDAYTTVNLTGGVDFGSWKLTAYVENLLDDHSITYVHPEAFLDGRYARLRPRTVGLRLGWDL
ncbi:TonB-dependent receptor [Stakelama saccharophila]|uniref:TonB-dependent receptor n=1 Tax=Stakelama saccharophila TaxID=3075605 RepID=A0ABZ0B6R6_9SPHN|nr:TonB-dependent receptor [Stakelama sp. W311]WNO52690.1 TonB-dependent receptor [Stakelama sp. W311]